LLKDALRRTAQAADIAGMRALFVIAKDDESAAASTNTSTSIPARLTSTSFFWS